MSLQGVQVASECVHVGDAAPDEMGLARCSKQKGTLFSHDGCNIFLPFRKYKRKLWLAVFQDKSLGFRASHWLNLTINTGITGQI